jgi:hypothetical protein
MSSVARTFGDFMRRHGILIALIGLAIVFYAIGFKKGSMIAFALAMLFELGFWVRLFKRDRSVRPRE